MQENNLEHRSCLYLEIQPNYSENFTSLNFHTKELPKSYDFVNTSVSSTSSDSKNSTNSAEKYKTELCKSFSETGKCRYFSKCRFAHGKEDLSKKQITKNYKQKKCESFFSNGFCSYGLRCNFIHDERKLEEILGKDVVKDQNKERRNNSKKGSIIGPSCFNQTNKKKLNFGFRNRLDVFKQLTENCKAIETSETTFLNEKENVFKLFYLHESDLKVIDMSAYL